MIRVRVRVRRALSPSQVDLQPHMQGLSGVYGQLLEWTELPNPNPNGVYMQLLEWTELELKLLRVSPPGCCWI